MLTVIERVPRGTVPARRPMLTYLAGGRASAGSRARARQGAAALLSQSGFDVARKLLRRTA